MAEEAGGLDKPGNATHPCRMRLLLPVGLLVLCCACSSEREGQQSAAQAAGQCVHEPGQTCPIEPRDEGCADLHPFEVTPNGGCLWIADAKWAAIEDDIACFELTPSDATCTRQCAGYLEIKNAGSAPMPVLARAKLGTDTAAHVKLGAPGDARCLAMAAGVTFAGGPTCDTYPPAAGCP
jgi:hypothetical protein